MESPPISPLVHAEGAYVLGQILDSRFRGGRTKKKWEATAPEQNALKRAHTVAPRFLGDGTAQFVLWDRAIPMNEAPATMTRRNNASPSGSSADRPALDPYEEEAFYWLMELQASDGDHSLRTAFEAWRAGDPRRAAAFEHIAGLWHSPEFGVAAVGLDAVRARARDAHGGVRPLMAQSRPVWRRRIAAAAACLAVIAALAHYSGLALRLRADHITVTGERRQVVLPDGSRMNLNSASAVAVVFDRDQRRVRLLDGEVHFEIAHDPDRPFRVASPHAEVEAAGTAFSVHTAAGRDKVSVQHGGVSVRARTGSAAPVGLRPLQSIAIGDGTATAAQTIDGDTVFAWLDGRIRFRDRRLAEVLDELRRHHRGVILVADRRIADIRVSGNYRLDDPALVVASLAEAVGAKLTHLSAFVLILH